MNANSYMAAAIALTLCNNSNTTSDTCKSKTEYTFINTSPRLQFFQLLATYTENIPMYSIIVCIAIMHNYIQSNMNESS